MQTTNRTMSKQMILSGIPLFHYSIIPFLRRRRGGRVVYCGGLENRFGLTADGGSNPSLSASFSF
jgi:hypothetical protein